MNFVFALNQFFSTSASNVRGFESCITECRNLNSYIKEWRDIWSAPRYCWQICVSHWTCQTVNRVVKAEVLRFSTLKMSIPNRLWGKCLLFLVTDVVRPFSVFKVNHPIICQRHWEGVGERVSKDKSEKTEMDGRNEKVRATLSLSDSLCLTLVTFSPVDAPSICLRRPARKVSAHTHCVRLSVRGCMPGQWQLRGTIYSRNHAGVQCVSTCLCRMCFSVSKVINHRKIRTVATCDLAMMTHSCTYVQPGLQASICMIFVAQYFKITF